MQSLQFQLHRTWNRVDDLALVPWTHSCCLDLHWWLDESHLGRGVSRTDLLGPRLLVRRLGCGLGNSLGSGCGFQPLVPRRGWRFHQCPRASSSGKGSPPLPVFPGGVYSGRVCGQLHGGVIPALFSSTRLLRGSFGVWSFTGSPQPPSSSQAVAMFSRTLCLVLTRSWAPSGPFTLMCFGICVIGGQ